MKRLILFGILSLSFISCQITERMYLSESGMIRQDTKIDITQMMPFAFTTEAIDSLKQLGEFPVEEIIPMSEATSFQEGDSENPPTEAEKEFAKIFSKSKVKYIQNDNEWSFTILTDEMDVKGFNKYQKDIEAAFQKLEKEDGESAKEYAESGYGSMMQLKYDGKTFEKEILNKKVTLEDESDSDSTEMSSRDILNMTEYTLEYHFEKPVKSTTLKDAVISEDGKTVTAKVKLTDLLENPEDYSFKAIFR